jgi:hypothetical protein
VVQVGQALFPKYTDEQIAAMVELESVLEIIPAE